MNNEATFSSDPAGPRSTDDDRNNGHEFVLRLYVAGASPNSTRAIINLREICETHLAGNYKLQIIDVYQDKALAAERQLLALPLLVKLSPYPERKLIGDMSDTVKVLNGLGIFP